MDLDVSNIEKSTHCTIKSISKKEDVSCEFERQYLTFREINQSYFPDQNINLPKASSYDQLRWAADLAALYLAYHNSQIHNEYQFDNQNKTQLFDDFEKARIIIIGSRKYRGIKLNLQKILEEEIDNITEVWDISYLLIAKSLSFFQYANIADFKDNVTQKINELETLVNNQENFAKVSADFINKINDEGEVEKEPQKDESQIDQPKDKSIKNNAFNNEETKDGAQKDEENIAQDIKDDRPWQESGSKPSRLSQGNVIASSYNEESGEEIEFIKEYKIFTKKHDLIVKACDLASKEELENLRITLDNKINNLERISSKLKSKLKRKLLSKKIIFNEFNKEEGLIDTKKLTKLITSPFKKDNYLEIKENNYQDTVISFLIDNSGSMRGNPIIMSAMACEIICHILEKFSIKTEILGFTTSKWHGGKSKQLWQMSGSPENPGRLSDLCHIIYKNSNQSLKRSKINMALMLKEGILKENIDGEALLWASKRLQSRQESRKILIVISDGAPVDDSTNSNNDENMLTYHLHKVISILEKKSDIELAAIGIGHDVGSFYKNSITIKDLEDLGDEMINKMCDLL